MYKYNTIQEFEPKVKIVFVEGAIALLQTTSYCILYPIGDSILSIFAFSVSQGPTGRASCSQVSTACRAFTYSDPHSNPVALGYLVNGWEQHAQLSRQPKHLFSFQCCGELSNFSLILEGYLGKPLKSKNFVKVACL